MWAVDYGLLDSGVVTMEHHEYDIEEWTPTRVRAVWRTNVGELTLTILLADQTARRVWQEIENPDYGRLNYACSATVDPLINSLS